MSLSKSNLKLIIFDVDGTLYDLKNVESQNFELQVSFYSKKTGLTRQEAENILNNNYIYSFRKKESKSATEFFKKNNFDLTEWNEYRSRFFDVSCIDTSNAPSNGFFELCSNNFQLYLVSSNSRQNVNSILNRLNILPNHFQKIFTSEEFSAEGVYSKFDIFKKILDFEHIYPNEALSVGDRFETDIKPILDLGGNGLLVKNKTEYIVPISTLIKTGCLIDLKNFYLCPS